MAGSVDAVLFDLDDTICAYRRPGADVLSLAFERVGVGPLFEVEDYYAIADDFVHDSESGPENRERCFAALAEEAGHDPALGRRVARAYAADRDHGNVRWVPGTRETLDALREEYALGLITNGDREWQVRKLRALDIEEVFDVAVYAGYDLPPKPDPTPFEVALDGLDVPAERGITVGDSLELDVEGAHNAGVTSIWLKQEGDIDPAPVPDYRIESMAELVEKPWVRE